MVGRPRAQRRGKAHSLQLGDERTHLLKAHRLARAHGAVAGEGDDQLVAPAVGRAANQEFVDHLRMPPRPARSAYIAGTARTSNAFWRPRTSSTSKPTPASRGNRLDLGALVGGQIEREGFEQRLHWNAPARADLAVEALVEQPLVRGVLVDQEHAVRAFGDDVGVGDLADHPQRRELGRRRRAG